MDEGTAVRSIAVTSASAGRVVTATSCKSEVSSVPEVGVEDPEGVERTVFAVARRFRKRTSEYFLHRRNKQKRSRIKDKLHSSPQLFAGQRMEKETSQDLDGCDVHTCSLDRLQRRRKRKHMEGMQLFAQEAEY